jgi:hypothetical protein
MTLVVGAALAASVAVAAPAAASDEPSLDPATVEATIFPGQTYEVDKSVQTPALPPKLDLCLVVDLSGSYADDLPNIKAVAPSLWDNLVAGGVADLQAGLASFVDFPIFPWGDSPSGDYAYRLDQDLTGTKATWVTAVNAMAVRNGVDEPESQYEALYQLVTGAGNDITGDVGDIAAGQQCNFRENATKVAVLTTDASFHVKDEAGGPFPYPGPSAADTTAALQAAGVKVIGLKAPGASGELDALATATGGAVFPTSSDSADIADAILAALEEIEIDVSMTSDCAATTSGVVTTTFEPDSTTVTSGEVATFTETISVAADAPGGVYECRDWALIDGEPMVDSAGEIVYETKTILVPENFVTGGGHVTQGKGKNRVRVLSFGGNAGYMADGTIVGHWTFQLPQVGIQINTTEITSIQFQDFPGIDPAPPEADADTALVTATARVKVGNGSWEEGCTVLFGFRDAGEPGIADQVAVADVTCPSSFYYDGIFLTGGNVQIHEGTKG